MSVRTWRQAPGGAVNPVSPVSPLSRTGAELPGAELLFEVFSQRCERGSILVTTNLPFDEWTGAFGPERLTGALLDRLTPLSSLARMLDVRS